MISTRRAAREEAFLRPAGDRGPEILAGIAQQQNYSQDEVMDAAGELPQNDADTVLRYAITNR